MSVVEFQKKHLGCNIEYKKMSKQKLIDKLWKIRREKEFINWKDVKKKFKIHGEILISQSIEKFISKLNNKDKRIIGELIDSLKGFAVSNTAKILDSYNSTLYEAKIDKFIFYYTTENQFIVIEKIIKSNKMVREMFINKRTKKVIEVYPKGVIESKGPWIDIMTLDWKLICTINSSTNETEIEDEGFPKKWIGKEGVEYDKFGYPEIYIKDRLIGIKEMKKALKMLEKETKLKYRLIKNNIIDLTFKSKIKSKEIAKKSQSSRN